jgi:hypothetical protein
VLATSTAVGSALLDAINAENQQVVSVIGLAKNVGKTVVVNTLLRQMAFRGSAAAVLSVGRDGEAYDALDDQRKPSVSIAAGTFALVPRSSLTQLPACKIIAGEPLESATGELLLIRALVEMTVELHGPRSAQAVHEIVARIRTVHAGCIIIDGALDRLASLVGPNITSIIATGSAVDRQMSTILERTQILLARLRMAAVRENEESLFVPGVLDELEAARYAQVPNDVALVVEDPLHITPGAFRRLHATRKLRARKAYRIAACSVNSVARSWSHRANELAQGVHQATQCLTVDCFRDVVLA